MVSAPSPVSFLVCGNDHPSLQIFRWPARTPGHLSPTSQPKNSSIRVFEHFRWNFVSSQPAAFNVSAARKTSAAAMEFSSPKCTSCVSKVVIVTGFKRSLKHSLHHPRMSCPLLSKTLFWSPMDLRSFAAKKPDTVCQNTCWFVSDWNPVYVRNSLNIAFRTFSPWRLRCLSRSFLHLCPPRPPTSFDRTSCPSTFLYVLFIFQKVCYRLTGRV